MITVGLYIYVDSLLDISDELIGNFRTRIESDGATFEGGTCIKTLFESLGGSFDTRLSAQRIELFNDEKISINSSIQNINDISKTFTDYSQTFTIPASKQNNKIFKHWYENSLNNSFSTLIKSNAYIELDTIPFRSGKIQLESCNIVNGQPENYSITFIGALGSLKDKFAGLFLKDLNTTFYDFNYSTVIVKDKVTTTATSSDIMFPLISSDRYWNYGATGINDISLTTSPIRYNELFPAIKLSAVFDMIDRDSKWNINFNGSFLSDPKFTSAYLYLKNADLFKTQGQIQKINYASQSGTTSYMEYDFTNNKLKLFPIPAVTGIFFSSRSVTLDLTFSVAGVQYYCYCYKNGILFNTVSNASIIGTQINSVFGTNENFADENDLYDFYISSDIPLTFTGVATLGLEYEDSLGYTTESSTLIQTISSITTSALLSVNKYFPEIKIEDFFSGILKMFNLTCYSADGINYTIEQLEDYYNTGNKIDITKYIKSDNINLNRVKSYKKINFEYEKSESLVNVGFKSANGVEYGSLLYDTGNDGEEYNIKLPFENLNFSNLSGLLQVGYCLKTDLQKYIPKPIILYDYNPSALTTAPTFHFSTALSGTGTAYTTYKAFGQEYYNGTETFSLNFNEQQSTLTGELIANSLYQKYYQNYLINIFNFKARLIKFSGILPVSLLTSLKLNDRPIIRDKRYLINNLVTDLTTGEVEFELLTDFREL
jgi:hypothetical protein